MAARARHQDVTEQADKMPLLTIDVIITVVCLVASVSLGGLLVWLEHRPREIGRPRLVPTTPLLLLCALVVVLALAHMVTIVTGVPHQGRLG